MRVLQGISGGLINPQVSGLVQQMFRGNERGRAFGTLGTTVGLGTALGPLVGGVLIALGGPDLGWRLVFFVNVPVGLVVIALARRFLPDTPATGRHRLDVIGSLLLGHGHLLRAASPRSSSTTSARWCCCSACRPLTLLALFYRRERRLTDQRKDPLVDLRLFRRPSYTAGVVLALAYFPAQAGLPLVMALYFQRGLGYSALQSALGVTAFAVGSAVAAQTAGRFVTRIGRPLVVGACLVFASGALAMALVARTAPTAHADAGAGRTAVLDGARQRRADHAQPGPDADGRRPGRGQHGGRRAADRATGRAGDRSGRDRRGLLLRDHGHGPGGVRPCARDGRHRALGFVAVATAVGTYEVLRQRRVSRAGG